MTVQNGIDVNAIVKVLVVDDSAYVRKMITQMLARSPFLEVVATARDGAEALELAAATNPDVVTCDLNMPEMDGVEFVKRQMAIRPVPIIIISVASQAGEQVLAALDAGAIDYLQKPTALATDRLLEVAEELVAKVKAAAAAPVRRIARAPLAGPVPLPVARAGTGLVDIVVLGISTGGPQALKQIIPQLPADLPVPIAVVIHMPVGYTELYSARLNEMSRVAVKEAAEGDMMVPGTVFIAPGGRHLSLHRVDGHVKAHLDVRPLDAVHRPSVDVLFQSASDAYLGRVLGVVMTGMGSDGRDGSAWIKAAGGRIVTEAEESCVVYGMPRAVVEAGLSDANAPLDTMIAAILERL